MKPKVDGDTKCDYGKEEFVALNLSPCNSSFFTCANGECVPMTVRCDKGFDCADQSDEKNCQKVSFDNTNYIKDEPPRKAAVKVKDQENQVKARRFEKRCD